MYPKIYIPLHIPLKLPQLLLLPQLHKINHHRNQNEAIIEIQKSKTFPDPEDCYVRV